MPVEDIDFVGEQVTEQDVQNNNSTSDTQNNEDVASINSNPDKSDITNKDNDNKDTNNNTTDTDTNDAETVLEEGTELEIDGSSYVVDKEGNIVDKDGNIFKKSDEVQAWLKEQNINDDNNSDDQSLSIEQIQKEVGITLNDEQGQPIEFTNDAQGVKNYINSVIDFKANEIREGAVNKLFADSPMLKEFVDYVQLTGTARGFGDIPDRSGITVDKDNEAQQEAIVRMAGAEFNNPNVNDNYIKYLKSTGALYEEAVNQLQALVQKDQQLHEQIKKEAELQRQQQIEEYNNYWSAVYDAISKRNIGGYTLPESIVKVVDGQKRTYTLNDFYDYVSKPAFVDDNGNYITAHQHDRNMLSDEEDLNKQILDAWLLFTGGTYKDLVAMATEENKVRKLIIKSKEQRNAKTVRINKPKSKVKAEDIIF